MVTETLFYIHHDLSNDLMPTEQKSEVPLDLEAALSLVELPLVLKKQALPVED